VDFALSDTQEALRRAVRSVTARRCPPEEIRRWEEQEVFPEDLWEEMGRLGWLGLVFPAEHGGAGGSLLDLMALLEELARVEFELASAVGLGVMGGLALLRHGTPEQQAHYLPPLVQGRAHFSVSLTEPGSGSDAAALVTRAVRDGDHFALTGQKLYCTGAHLPGSTVLLAARTGHGARKQDGITVFCLDPTIPGVTLRRMRMLGRRIQGTNEIFLDGARVPASSILGRLDGGWAVLRSFLEVERTVAAVAYAGAAQAVVDLALAYAKEREQFGRPVGSFQAIAHLLADMQTDVDATRLLAWRAAWLLAAGRLCLREVSVAKLHASETYVRVAGHGMQVMGGHGYTMECDMQRHFRSARLATIGAGTSQIQRDLIARAMGLDIRHG
jgi:alkylation response protein AidB-like acyl-CoA dehydrogenase